MEGSKRTTGGKRSSLKHRTVTLSANAPPLGYKAPPVLIGWKTIDPSVLTLRAKNYALAYNDTACTVQQWNTYVSFGIQDFVSLSDYSAQCEKECSDERNLRIARYYRRHLETKTSVDSFLVKTIPSIELALQQTHPGFLDMSISDMDTFLSDYIPSAMDVDSTPSSLAIASQNNNNTPTQQDSTLDSQSTEEPDVHIPDEPATPKSPPATHNVAKNNPDTPSTKSMDTSTVASGKTDQTSQTSQPTARRPKAVNNVLRIETRWAPKDFHELRASTSKHYTRLAPILSCFNTSHTWMMEWQTDQMDKATDIEGKDISKYLSIRVVPVAKAQCFYFSFRIHATGSQFTKVVQSTVLQTAKRGENLTFDPSSIPPKHGELTFIGDILLKDASVTHRGHYLQYLRNEILPPDTPIFDMKVRYGDPTGAKKYLFSPSDAANRFPPKLPKSLALLCSGKATILRFSSPASLLEQIRHPEVITNVYIRSTMLS